SPDSIPTVVQDSHSHLIDSFLQRVQAKITHIGFGHHGQIWRKLTTPMEEGDTDVEIDPREEENVEYMLHILDIKVPKKGAALETTPKTKAIPWPELETSPSKANPKLHLLPEQPLHAEPMSMGTDVTNLPHGRDRLSKERSTKRNSRADSWLAVFSGGGSPANGKSNKSPSPAPSQKNEGKKWVKDIIASVTSSGQRPAARVRTPEHTPRIAAKDLVSDPAPAAATVNHHGRIVSENMSNPSVVTDTSANNRASVSITSTPERISTSIPPSRSPLHANNEQILTFLERVIIHDAAPDDLKLRDCFNHYGIRVDVHR
ncbi:3618_t:CDS:2, partial [Acaulospora colombiana]